ncbi:MAG: hypothetical protein ACRC8C_02640 [Mycoplasmoidaceae bacterium]
MNKKIKISLIGSLIIGSALMVTLPIVSCSSSTSDESKPLEPLVPSTPNPFFLKVDTQELNNIVINTTNLFKTNFSAEKTREDQEKFADLFKSGSKLAKNSAYEDEIKKIIFTNAKGEKINGVDVIEEVIITEGIVVNITGDAIKGPTLKISFKLNYISSQDIIVEVGNIGISL